MAVTVQEQVFKLAIRIDPRNRETGEVFTLATVGTADGKFPKQRLVDLYNQARTLVFSTLEKHLPVDVLAARLSGLKTVNTITFGNWSGVSRASMPEDYIKLMSIATSPGLVPMNLSPSSFVKRVLRGEHHYKQTTTNINIFEEGRTFAQYVNAGGAMYTGDAYLTYLGLTDWTLADVTNGSVPELFNKQYQDYLIDFAEGLSANVGNADMTKLIEKLLMGV